MRFAILALSLLSAPASAHELWIEPLAYEVPVEGRIEARLVNGETFQGIDVAYFPRRFQRFDLLSGEAAVPVAGRIGDRPALRADPLGEGLHVAVYQSVPATVTYATYEEFARFGAHKDFAGLRAAHEARALPESDFSEVYTRYSKALIGVGAAAGADRRSGLETEIVALDNPYTADLAGGMRVQVFDGAAVRADAQVELFARAPDGTVEVTLHRTDAQGVALLPVRPGHAYLVDAVVLRQPAAALAQETGAVWETLWAALTFRVPD